jgi:hypothetical protein
MYRKKLFFSTIFCFFAHDTKSIGRPFVIGLVYVKIVIELLFVLCVRCHTF